MRIPIYGKASCGQPLRDIVARTAARLCMSDYLVAIVMSYFFEYLAIQITKGKRVVIPGIGAFCSVMYSPNTLHEDDPELSYPSPRFYPARGLRIEVGSGLGPTWETQKQTEKYHQNHCVVPTRTKGKAGRGTTMSAMKKFRADIAAQARNEGLDYIANLGR